MHSQHNSKSYLNQSLGPRLSGAENNALITLTMAATAQSAGEYNTAGSIFMTAAQWANLFIFFF